MSLTDSDLGKVRDAISSFLTWFEDNFGDETWLDSQIRGDDDPRSITPDGIWRSYYELPEYRAAVAALEKLES